MSCREVFDLLRCSHVDGLFSFSTDLITESVLDTLVFKADGVQLLQVCFSKSSVGILSSVNEPAALLSFDVRDEPAAAFSSWKVVYEPAGAFSSCLSVTSISYQKSEYLNHMDFLIHPMSVPVSPPLVLVKVPVVEHLACLLLLRKFVSSSPLCLSSWCVWYCPSMFLIVLCFAHRKSSRNWS